MKKLSLVVLSCAVFALSGCETESGDTLVVIDPIEITEAMVTIPNQLEQGVFSTGLFETRTFTVGEAWAIDPTTVPSWLTVDPVSGNKGEITIKFTVVQENGSWVEKMASVIIKPLTGESATVRVNYQGLSEGTIYVPAAGELGTLLASVADKRTLKIMGNLNATDFATLKGITTLENLNLKGAHLEDTTIPNEAFRNNQTLKSVVFPNSLTSVGANAFCDCGALTGTLVIPALVTSIGEAAFLRTGLSEFKSLMPTPPTNILGTDIFGDTQMGLLDLIIPIGSTDAYLAQGWGGFQMMFEE